MKARVCEGCDQEQPSTVDRIAHRRDDLTPLEYTVRYCDDCAAIINAGEHAAYNRVTPPLTFPRAEAKYPLGYFRFYAKDYRALMRAWVLQEMRTHFEVGGDEDAIRVIAEGCAVEEIRRELNAHEAQLLGYCVRDLLVATITAKSRHEERERELAREVL